MLDDALRRAGQVVGRGVAGVEGDDKTRLAGLIDRPAQAPR